MRGKRDISLILIICGLLVASAPVAVSITGNVLAQRAQHSQLDQWEGTARAVSADTPDFPFLLEIPKIRLRWLVYQGADLSSMRRHGAGHLTGTAVPGQPGVAGIAGHRTTYGAPFWHLHQVGAGDTVVIQMAHRTLTYRVVSTAQVTPTAVEILQARAGGSFLVLITCSPPLSAAYRLVVFAILDGAMEDSAAFQREVPLCINSPSAASPTCSISSWAARWRLRV